MNQMPFEPPVDHYEEQLESIDEQICKLIKQRKELSDNNPGFPTKELMSRWATKYNLYEDFVKSVFSHLLDEEMYKPVVEPKGFQKNVPVLKSFEKDSVFYSVTFVRQFENASVVHFTIDQEDFDGEMDIRKKRPSLFYLSVEGEGAVEYDCRNNFGGGSVGHQSFTFTVSPALPDDLSNIKLIFKEYIIPLKKTSGFEFVIQMDN
ncbi:hypothetical protein F9U64_12085 [Gracilibacillus oryzae]|uniref:Uncharacterized protein n=1 Tax=Gracilibacillus oryzae TaxID=1672701 RepID=A0A7C8GTG0_9BACI|nr:hypothetical protein [Gracilibacillus oryzae]KAB8133635.1 hypothetical protein F9U64_12085 [Gracilibacillus oryzae]